MIEKYKKISDPLKASIWFALSNILRKIIVYISMPIFTRIMSTEQYGIYTLYCSWSEIIFLFTTLSISTNVYNKCVIKYKNNIWKFTSSILILPIFASAIFLGIYILLGEWIKKIIQLPMELIILIIIDSIFTPAFNYWAITERFNYRYKKIVFLSLIQTIINPILGFIMVVYIQNSGVMRCMSVVLSNSIINIPVFFWILYKGKNIINWKYWKYVLESTIPLLPHYLSQILLNQMDRIMIGNLCGVNYSAIYGIAYAVAIASLIVNRAINDSFVPWLYNKIAQNEISIVPKIVNGLLIFIAIMDYFVILIGPEIIKILGPKEYYKAVWIIPPVAISAYLLFLYSLFCNIEFYFEVKKYMTIVSIIVAIINYILNNIFIKIFGFIAAGYTTLFCYILFALLHYFVMKKTLYGNNLEKIYDYRFMFKISSILLIGGIATSLLYNYQLLRYCLIIGAIFITILKKNEIKKYIILYKNK